MNKLIAVLLSISFFSCGEHKRQEIKEASREVVESYGRGGTDLVETFYRQLLNNSDELKKLDDEVNDFRASPREASDEVSKYLQKSSSYYSSAENKTASISDSVLRKKMVLLIANSKKSYANRTQNIDSLLNSIAQKDAAIYDHYTILKIVLTLPLIEKYQKDNLPDTKGLKELMKEQNHLLQQIDKTSPKF